MASATLLRELSLGWTLRNPSIGAPDQQVSMLEFSRFPATKAEREAIGDPRLSIEERYATREFYLERVREEVKLLAAQRYLLPDAVDNVVES
jgi:hypothetical protein